MRLTPFRFRSSSGSDRDETSISADVEIHHVAFESRVDQCDTKARVVDTSISGQDIVTILEELDTPVTVDEIADRLVHPHDVADVEAWGDVHERLYQDELPALAEAGLVDFDTKRGTVDVSEDQGAHSSRGILTTRTVAVTALLGLVGASLLFVPVTVATILSIGFLTFGVLAYALVLFPLTP